MLTHTFMRTFTGIRYKVMNKTLGAKKVTVDSNTYVFDYPCNDSTACTPYEVLFSPGRYKIELWGAQGGDSRYQNTGNIRKDSGAKGAYVSGEIYIAGTTVMYLYIGGRGENQFSRTQVASKGGYNGGGMGGVDLNDEKDPESGSGGGGATDFRLKTVENNELASLKSRIIVASGGVGSSSANSSRKDTTYKGFDGGMVKGGGNGTICIAGTQTKGIFGKGGDGKNFSSADFEHGGSTAGSGAGYYGGYTKKINADIIEAGGASGSSYISGHSECDSVANDASDPPKHTGSKYHYSSLFFTSTSMKAKGSSGFVNQYGTSEKGHHGNGAAKITIISAEQSVPLIFTCNNKGPYRNRPEKYVFVTVMVSA